MKSACSDATLLLVVIGGCCCASRNASLLTRCGELFLLHSSSEYVHMSLSARRVLRPSCHIDILPQPHSTFIDRRHRTDEHVDLAESHVSQTTSSVERALVNGAEQSLDEYVQL